MSRAARRDFSRAAALALMTGLLLLVALTRVPGLSTLQLDADEVWSVWQSVDGPAQIVLRTPYDWTPTYYLAMGGWTSLVGIHPLAVRMLPLLSFMLGVAFAYQAARALGGRKSGLVFAFLWAALGYQVFISTYVRGGAAAVVLLPLVLWLLLRYQQRPTWKRAVLAALPTAGIVHIYLNAPVALAFVFLFLAVLYGRRSLRLWKPVLLSGLLMLPALLPRLGLAVQRTNATQTLPSQGIAADFAGFVSGVFGPSWGLWLALLIAILIAAAIAGRRRSFNGFFWAALVWFAAGPIVLYAANRWLGFFTPHYAWWVATTFGLLASSVVQFVKPAWVLVMLAATGALMFLPPERSQHIIPTPPVSAAFAWLQPRMGPGDVLVTDPACNCPPPEVWDYYRSVYFSNGLAQADEPGDARRVWYLTMNGREDPELKAGVQSGRIAGEFIGPWDFLLRLYEGPPDPAGIAFENGMRLHGVEILPNHGRALEQGVIVRREGEPLHMRLWWSADRPLDRDYSVGLYALYSGQVIAQDDGPPAPRNGPAQTSAWEPGALYVEERTLNLPDSLWMGAYDLALTVYDWQDPAPIPAEGYPDGLVPVGSFRVMAW